MFCFMPEATKNAVLASESEQQKDSYTDWAHDSCQHDSKLLRQTRQTMQRDICIKLENI